MVDIKQCPVCNANSFRQDLVCKDYTVSKEDFNLVVCESCGFKFTNPRPENSVIGNYYKSEDYISHSNTSKGIISKLYHAVRNYTLKNKLALISKYVSKGTILDYGCGTGMFLNTCKNAGWKTFGIEPDQGARKMAAEAGTDVFENKDLLLDKYPEQKFDVITLWHVLEHVTDLGPTLDFLKSKLNPDGVLIIAVPNHTSFDAKHYREFWAAYDVPRHLYHFERKTIQQLLARFQFKLADTKPMKFDSFYVSMLSEKYKTGAIKYPAAFITGLRSNLKASLAENYSSVIYIFKKA